VPSTLRILVVADDSQVGRWLGHRIDTVEGAHQVEVDDGAGFERRIATHGAAQFDVLLAVLDFSATAAVPAFGVLDQLLGIPDLPPIVVVAQHGDELAAAGAMRRGAVDYVPRQLLDAELLQHAFAAAKRARAPMHATAGDLPAVVPQALQVPRDLIPRYTLLDTIGQSARATVYLAHSVALNRHVALKVSRMVGEEESQFAREFEAAGGLRHASVVDIYDYGMHDGREFIAMEYFPCGDLKARLQNPLTEQDCLDYLAAIARALTVVHGQGILHRDLKPPNIMLRDDGQVVLIDFGLARNIDATTHNTRAGVLRGSPYYMSPEQAQGAELDARSDLYSLGVIFYEMLTGTKPYHGSTAIEVLQQHVTGALPLLDASLAHHQALLEGMLAKQRDDRFESAQALLDALGNADAAAEEDAAETSGFDPRQSQTLPSLAQMQQSLVTALSLLRAPPQVIGQFLGTASATVAGIRATLKLPARDLPALRGKLGRLREDAARLATDAQENGFAPIAEGCRMLVDRIHDLQRQDAIGGDDMLPLAMLVDRVAASVGNVSRFEEQRYKPADAGPEAAPRTSRNTDWNLATERRWRGFARSRGELIGAMIKLRMEGADKVPTPLRRHVDELLQYLLRNAVDHGIETPEQRLAHGKTAVGHITVVFEDHDDAHISMTVRDDGRGMEGKPREGRGLTQMRKVVARVGGSVVMQTERGQYTQYIVQLLKTEAPVGETATPAASLDNI
jgi:eukaryotic-like serine/threonine-protein kinase